MSFLKRTGKELARQAGFDITRRLEAHRDDIHFLHIGKCAGTQILSITKQVNAKTSGRKIRKHGHDVFLRHLPEEADFFFSIRDPTSRFRSGFYSRKRKGQPRHFSEWSRYDAFAFTHFPHANDLAESLFEPGERGARAWAAMKSVRHTAQNQSDWFDCCGSFLDLRPPVWIIRQEAFEADLARFFKRASLGVGIGDIEIKRDKVSAHANDYSDIPPLSDLAREKLRIWYAQDYAFHAACIAWIEAQDTV